MDLLKKASIIQWNVWKEKNVFFLATKLKEKVTAIIIFIWWEKKYKIGKTIKNNYLSKKTIENTNIVDIKSIIIEHEKTYKTIKQAAKIFQVGARESSDGPLYKDTKKVGAFWMKRLCKFL